MIQFLPDSPFLLQSVFTKKLHCHHGSAKNQCYFCM